MIMKKHIEKAIMLFTVFMLLLMTALPNRIYSTEETPVTTETSDTPSTTSDVVDSAIGAISEGEEFLVRISVALFPVSLIICFILIMVTHNDRKMQGLIYISGIICVATLLILLTHSGFTLNLIKQLAGLL